jgi:hypothetical protein
VEKENPIACATVNWKLCKSVIALYCLYFRVFVKGGVNKSYHPNYKPLFSSRVPRIHVTILSSHLRLCFPSDVSFSGFPPTMSHLPNACYIKRFSAYQKELYATITKQL